MHVSIKIMMKYIFTRARTSNNRIHIPPNPRIVHYIYTPNYRNGCERKFAFQLAYRGNTLDTAGARAGRKLAGFSDICLSKLRTGVCAFIVHLCVYMCVYRTRNSQIVIRVMFRISRIVFRSFETGREVYSVKIWSLVVYIDGEE